jgi:2-polyprenyl-3-methyl-5-hydroxy-6-metoxy-1,4-benzoquinol methylase
MNMNNDYWDSLADEFGQHILNVHHSDKEGLLETAIDTHVDQSKLAADFGCGVGWGIPSLARIAKRVYAIDGADSLLQHARKLCDQYNNIEYLKCDLSRKAPDIPKVEAALCVNVLLASSQRIRDAILRNMSGRMARGGVLLVVTPALESQLWVHSHMVAISQASKNGSGLSTRSAKQIAKKEVHSLIDGVINLEESLTKYFLGPELEQTLQNKGYEVLSREAIEYDWEAENIETHDEGVPRPWHWLVVAKKL